MDYKLERIPSTRAGRYIVKAPEGFPGARYAGLYTYEHRAVWWLHHGYLPPKGYHIHHINGDPTDNRIENLEAISASDHAKERHHGGKHVAQYVALECHYCKSAFTQLERSVRYRKSLGQTRFWCAKRCQIIERNHERKGCKNNYPKNRRSKLAK